MRSTAATISPHEVVEDLASRYAGAASALIASDSPWAAALVLCSGIDALAGLHAGREAQEPSAGAFVAFVDEFMAVLRPPPPGAGSRVSFDVPALIPPPSGQLAWSTAPDRPIESCADLLYRGYRCGLIHEGATGRGLDIVDREGPLFVIRIDQLNDHVAYHMDLNIRPFLQEFREAAGRYVERLRSDSAARERFRRRWEAISAPQWTLTT